jgi:hypothetical protein
MTNAPAGSPLPPGGPVVPGRTSGLAVASLVLGVLGFCTFGLSALVGLILGIVGLSRISAGGGRLRGKELAIAGIVVSGVCLSSLPMMAGIAIPAFSAARGRANLMKSSVQARLIATSAAAWSDGHGGRWPGDIGMLLIGDGVEPLSPKLLLCPGTCTRVPEDYASMTPAQVRAWAQANSGYILVDPGQASVGAAAMVVLQKPEYAIRGRVAAGYADCHAAVITVAQAMAELRGRGVPGGMEP